MNYKEELEELESKVSRVFLDLQARIARVDHAAMERYTSPADLRELRDRLAALRHRSVKGHQTFCDLMARSEARVNNVLRVLEDPPAKLTAVEETDVPIDPERTAVLGGG